MAAVIICSDFGMEEYKACHCFHCFPIYLPWRPFAFWNGPHSVEYVSSGASLTFWDDSICWGCSRLLRRTAFCLWNVYLSKLIQFLFITLPLTEFLLCWNIKKLSFIKSWDLRMWLDLNPQSWTQGPLEFESSTMLELVGSDQFMSYPQWWYHSFKGCALPPFPPISLCLSWIKWPCTWVIFGFCILLFLPVFLSLCPKSLITI